MHGAKIDFPGALALIHLEIVEPERLVMTIDTAEHPAEWHELFSQYRGKGKAAPPIKIVMTVTFEEHHGGTKLTVVQRFESLADRDAILKMGAAEGWTQGLDRLEEHLASA